MPGPPLARLRSWGCTLSGFSEDLGRTVRRVEVVSPRIKAVIGFGAGYLLGAGKNQRRHQAFVVGNPAGPTTVEHDDAQSCVEVALPPWAAATACLTARRMSLPAELSISRTSGAARRGLLAEALHGAPAWERRFEIVEQVSARRLVAPRRAVPAALRWACGRTRARAGSVPVRQRVRQDRMERTTLRGLLQGAPGRGSEGRGAAHSFWQRPRPDVLGAGHGA
ncbi:hypothetical protein ACU4GD_05310 [Cupriavidus basilensis]